MHVRIVESSPPIIVTQTCILVLEYFKFKTKSVTRKACLLSKPLVTSSYSVILLCYGRTQRRGKDKQEDRATARRWRKWRANAKRKPPGSQRQQEKGESRRERGECWLRRGKNYREEEEVDEEEQELTARQITKTTPRTQGRPKAARKMRKSTAKSMNQWGRRQTQQERGQTGMFTRSLFR